MNDYVRFFVQMELPFIIIIQILVVSCVVLYCKCYKLKSKDEGNTKSKFRLEKVIDKILETMKFSEE